MVGAFTGTPGCCLSSMTLAGGTAFLCSMALAVFGLTNAALQILSGHLGDRLGRKSVLLGALVLLAAGMMIGYFAKNIWGPLHSPRCAGVRDHILACLLLARVGCGQRAHRHRNSLGIRRAHVGLAPTV